MGVAVPWHFHGKCERWRCEKFTRTYSGNNTWNQVQDLLFYPQNKELQLLGLMFITCNGGSINT
jgi:hypothetical protein